MKKEYKEGVDLVFEQNPKLAKIGTEEEYSKYIKTIFPERKVQNIVYHQTSRKFKEFKTEKSRSGGIYFSSFSNPTPLIARILLGLPFEGTVKEYNLPVLVNIKNPLKITKKENPKLVIQNINRLSKKVDLSKYDGVVGFANTYYDKGQLDSDILNIDSKKNNSIEIVAFNPNQIHILGSEQDIGGFKNYVKNKNQENQKRGSLENKIISGLFILSIAFGIFLTTFNLTGNVIGTSETAHRLIGIILFLFGISGFFIYRKLNKN